MPYPIIFSSVMLTIQLGLVKKVKQSILYVSGVSTKFKAHINKFYQKMSQMRIKQTHSYIYYFTTVENNCIWSEHWTSLNTNFTKRNMSYRHSR